MKLIFSIISVLILFSNCSQTPIDFDKEVYNDILIDLVNIDQYYLPPPLPGMLHESQTKNGTKSEYDTILQDYYLKIDTINKYLFIYDTLEAISLEEIDGILDKQFDLKTYNLKYLSKKPLSIKNFERMDIGILLSGSISNDSLLNSFGFNNGKLYIGHLSISRVLLNDAQTEGFLLSNFVCGSKCGERCLIWIEKYENRWKIKERFTLAIY